MKYKVLNLLKTREFESTLTDSETDILDFVEKNFADIPKYSVMELCEKSFSSQGTVNRLCKKLGFRGYTELKYSIEEDLNTLKNRKNIYINDMSFFLDNINFDQINSILKILKNNKKIILYGLGASRITAAYFQRQLLYLGYETILLSEENMFFSFNDFIFLIISSSGETPRVMHIAKKLKERQMMLLSITKSNSSLDRISNASFTHNIPIDKLNFITREQQLHMIIMVNELIHNL